MDSFERYSIQNIPSEKAAWWITRKGTFPAPAIGNKAVGEDETAQLESLPVKLS